VDSLRIDVQRHHEFFFRITRKEGEGQAEGQGEGGLELEVVNFTVVDELGRSRCHFCKEWIAFGGVCHHLSCLPFPLSHLPAFPPSRFLAFPPSRLPAFPPSHLPTPFCHPSFSPVPLTCPSHVSFSTCPSHVPPLHVPLTCPSHVYHSRVLSVPLPVLLPPSVGKKTRGVSYRELIALGMCAAV
jgi:hypothetical protein